MKELLCLNPEHVTDNDVATYPVREAARAVVLDGENKVAFLHVSRDGYYKLPGGGIDEGESKEAALRRECKEEIGCDVEIVFELGKITEYRRFSSTKQISYCYVARCVGKPQAPQFTESEKERGFEPAVWVTFDEALKTLEKSDASTLEGQKYIVPRDIGILKESRKHI